MDTVDSHRQIRIISVNLIFPFLANVPTFVTPENTRKAKVFCYFQGIKNENIGQKLVKLGESVSISEKCGSVPHLGKLFIITNSKENYLNLSTDS